MQQTEATTGTPSLHCLELTIHCPRTISCPMWMWGLPKIPQVKSRLPTFANPRFVLLWRVTEDAEEFGMEKLIFWNKVVSCTRASLCRAHIVVSGVCSLLWEAPLLLLHPATSSPSKSLLAGRKYCLGISVWKSGPVIQKLAEIIRAVPACIKIHYSKATRSSPVPQPELLHHLPEEEIPPCVSNICNSCLCVLETLNNVKVYWRIHYRWLLQFY